MKTPARLTLPLCAATLIACSAEPPATVEAQGPIAETAVLGTAVVAAANPYATDAGLAVLEAGGSAVDAAVAIQAALGLVEPQSSGLAGGAFMIVHDPVTDETWMYDGRETAPAGITAEVFQADDGSPIRYLDAITSGHSTGVPGAVVMLDMAHDDYGRLPWAELFDPVIPLAEDGFEMPGRMSFTAARAGRFALKNDPEALAYFFDAGGEVKAPGTRITNPEYAEVLRALARNPRALLEGPIAEDIVAETRLEPRPGTLSLADMAAYRPRKREALCSSYRTYRICGPQPPSSGGVAVQAALGLMEGFDMAALGPTPAGWHVFIEASRLAYADRDRYVGDDAFVDVPVAQMLDRDYLDSRAALISTDAAIPEVTAGDPAGFVMGADATPDSPGTSHFSVVDADGLIVSMTTTVESVMGSQRFVRGMVLNNQLTDFSFRDVDDRGRPIANAVAPGKRPRSSMSPSIVFDANGDFAFSTGSPGGNSIIAYTLKTVVGMIDWGLDPQAAADLPNVIARGDRVKIEANLMDAASLDALEAMGHQITRSDGEASGIHIIATDDGETFTGAADSRREGKVGQIEVPKLVGVGG